MLEDLITIVIPTHFRHRLLARTLDYYRGRGLPIIVCDSTDVPFARAGEYPGVRYRHMGGMSYSDKLQRIVREVETPYFVFCADDSFTVPRAIRACVEFLEANPDCMTAQGHYVSATRESGRLVLRRDYLGTESMRVDSDRPEARMREFFSPYMPIFYAVQRTANWQETPLCELSGITCYNLLELASGLIPTIRGKHKVLDLFYVLLEPVPSQNPKRDPRAAGYDVIAVDPAYRAELERFREILAGVLAAETGMPRDAARAEVLGALEHYRSRYCVKTPKKSLFRKLPKYFRRAIAGASFRVDPEGSLVIRQGIEQAQGEIEAKEFQEFFSRFDDQARAELDAIVSILEGELRAEGQAEAGTGRPGP